MGVVYEAEQESLGRHVALKVLAAYGALDPRHLQRFQREARASARLHHTNIVPVHGVGEQDGLYYYVMQFIQGLGLDAVLDELKRLRRGKQVTTPGVGQALQPDSEVGQAFQGDRQAGKSDVRANELSVADVAQAMLTGQFEAIDSQPAEGACELAAAPLSGERLQRRSAAKNSSVIASMHLPGQAAGASFSEAGSQYWRSIARIGIQVAEALAYASSQGILHRDIKPSNLLLDTHGTVWVTDFGLAKADDDADNLTRTGDVIGTLRYMAPECFQGQADARSDLYALGLTLYELMTLRPAFDEHERSKLIRQVLHDDPPRPRKLDPTLPSDLETIVLKATARDPAHRYQTPGELADDLQRFLDDRPIRARPLGFVQRGWRWCRRKPAMAGLTAIAAALLVLVAVVASVGYVAGATQRKAAELAKQDAVKQQWIAREAGERARQEAEWNRRLLYDADMQLAAQLWESETGTARAIADLLEAHVPKDHEVDLRDFTWHYQRNLLHRAVVVDLENTWEVCLSPDGALTTLDSNGVLSQWGKVRRGTARPAKAMTLPSSTCWAFTADGTMLGYGTQDGMINWREIATGRHGSWRAGSALKDLVFSDDGTKLASIHVDNQAQLWDFAGNTLLATASLMNTKFRSLALSPDGRTLVLADHPENAELFVLHFGAKETQILRGHGSTISCVAFSPDGESLASGDGHVVLWNTATWQERGRLFPKGGWVARLAFSPDGRSLATGSSDGAVTIWDHQTRQRLLRLKGHTASIHSLAFSGNGTTLATASEDGTARVWNWGLASADGCRLFGGRTARLRGPVYSPDDRWFATSGDRTRIWDARTEQLVLELAGSGCVAFSPDSTLLATATESRISLWDVASGQPLRTLDV
ncbi:MAG: protein kinase domain-containing protein, partial [Terriglobales bacterium]